MRHRFRYVDRLASEEPAAPGDSGVLRGGAETAILIINDVCRPRTLLDEGHGIVRRRIVDMNQLDIAIRLRGQRGEAAAEKRCAVPGDDDGRDQAVRQAPLQRLDALRIT